MTWQAAITALATIIASGALWQLWRVRSEVRGIEAEAKKSEQEAHNLAFERMKELAEYYRQRWADCEGHKPPSALTPPTQKGRL